MHALGMAFGGLWVGDIGYTLGYGFLLLSFFALLGVEYVTECGTGGWKGDLDNVEY